MKKHVILAGNLGDLYGSEWHVKAKTLKDVFQCINANYPSFNNHMLKAVLEDKVNYTIQNGEEFIGEEDLNFLLSEDTVIITEVPAGAKGGTGKIITGIILIAAYVYLNFAAPGSGEGLRSFIQGASKAAAEGTATLGQKAALAALNASAMIGINLTLAGIQQLNAPDPSVDDNETDYLFNGPAQTVLSGRPIPYLFGRKVVGGIPISSDLVPGNLPQKSGYYRDPNTPYDYPHYYPNYNYDSPEDEGQVSADEQSEAAVAGILG